MRRAVSGFLMSLLAAYCLTAEANFLPIAVAAEIQTDFAMHSDPVLDFPKPIKRFNPKYKVLWLQALNRPEADMQRLAAETIAQAHPFGFPGLVDAKPALIKILSAPDTHPTVCFAVARALIVLECKDSAPFLFDASGRQSIAFRQLVEPALAAWDFQPIGKVWKERLENRDARYADVILAIQGLERLADRSAAPALLQIVLDPFRAATLRLAAARSAGRLKESGLEVDAASLENSSHLVLGQLCAVALLESHRSEPARAVLLRMAAQDEPAVKSAALGRLQQIDPDLVVPLAEAAMQNLDANVRQRGVDAYVARPTPQRVAAMAKLLGDPHPAIRGGVREALWKLSKKDAALDAAIRPAAMQVLAGEGWRGHEQAALLLAALDHEPAAPLLVQLLESPRREVMTTTAWALRKLAVPDTLPAILDKARRQTESRIALKFSSSDVDVQVAHLCEAMGLMKFSPGEPLLRQYIKKDGVMGEVSRGAAIWALGHLHVNQPDAALAVLLVERLTEPIVIPPELAIVRTMSAISLGRMKAVDQADRMRAYLGPTVTLNWTSLAIRWALGQLTGEVLPDPEPEVISRSGWFLEPLDP